MTEQMTIISEAVCKACCEEEKKTLKGVNKVAKFRQEYEKSRINMSRSIGKIIDGIISLQAPDYKKMYYKQDIYYYLDGSSEILIKTYQTYISLLDAETIETISSLCSSILSEQHKIRENSRVHAGNYKYNAYLTCEILYLVLNKYKIDISAKLIFK